MIKFHEIILTFFYCGKSKIAPGSVGSLAALIIWFFTNQYFFHHEISQITQNIFCIIFLSASLIYGSFAIKIYTKNLGQIDHSSIVLDEVVWQIITLQASSLFIADYFNSLLLINLHLISCYILFRFFDIVKPSVIGFVDKNLKTGFGVMLDDVLSGAAAAAAVAAIAIFLL